MYSTATPPSPLLLPESPRSPTTCTAPPKSPRIADPNQFCPHLDLLISAKRRKNAAGWFRGAGAPDGSRFPRPMVRRFARLQEFLILPRPSLFIFVLIGVFFYQNREAKPDFIRSGPIIIGFDNPVDVDHYEQSWFICVKKNRRLPAKTGGAYENTGTRGGVVRHLTTTLRQLSLSI